MKKIVSSLLTLVLVAVLCVPVTVKADSVFRIYGGSGINMGADATGAHIVKTGGTVNIAVVTANNEVWSATKNVSWIQLSKTTGQASNPTVTITVLGNTYPIAREGVITFKAAGQEYNYHIYQEAGNSSVVTKLTPELYVEKTSLNSTVNGQSFFVTVGSNTAWSAKADCNWIKFVDTNTSSMSHGGTMIMYFATTDNTTGKGRVGHLVVRAGSLTQTITITQAGK